MATLGFSGMGSTVVIGSTTIGEVESFNLGGDVTEYEEILTIDSTDYYPELILTAFSTAEITLTCIFQPGATTGNYDALKTLHDARTKTTFTWTFLNTASYTGTVGIVGLTRPESGDAKSVMRFTITMRASGKISYTGS
jgi:hypothetical protein